MKPILKTFTLLILALALSSPGIQAQTAVPDEPAASKPPLPAPPQLAAKSYILVDFNSGRVLVENNANMRVEPASITKLMTAYVVFQELDEGNITLEDPVPVSDRARHAGLGGRPAPRHGHPVG